MNIGQNLETPMKLWLSSLSRLVAMTLRARKKIMPILYIGGDDET